MIKQSETHEKTRRLLRGVRQREKGLRILLGCVAWVFLLVVLLLGGALLESAFRFSSLGRYAFSTIFFLSGILSFIWLIGLPLYAHVFRSQSPDDVAIALKIGQTFPAISDRLADALQVFRKKGETGYGTSSSLADASLERMYESVEALDLRRVVSKKKLIGTLRVGGGVVLFCIVVGLVWHRPLGQALVRLAHPGHHYAAPQPFHLTVTPGDARLVQGEDVVMNVRVEGDAPDRLFLYYKEGESGEREETLMPPYAFRFASVREDISYWIQGGPVRTPVYRIKVLRHPLIRALQVAVEPPGYAKQDMRILEPNAGEVRALKGSVVLIEATASKPLSRASLVLDHGGRHGMRLVEKGATTEFTVRQEDRYRIELTDTLGLRNVNPISYTVRMVPDLNPVARIRFPGENVDLDESMVLPLSLEAEDDYGLGAWRLGYSVHRGGTMESGDTVLNFHPLELQEGEPPKASLDFTWDVASLDLMPEDVVSYFLEAEDNDDVSGPKRARSRTYTARFPSIYEIFQEVEAAQANQVETLEEIYDESREMYERLERIGEEMRAGYEQGWEKKKALEGMAERQEKMVQEVDSLKAGLEEMVDRMDRNELMSIETLEKYQELQELYEEMATPELLEAMKKLQEMMAEMDQEALKRAAEKFQLSQEGFLRSIERTLSLLKRIQVAQKVDEIIRRIDDLTERQASVNQRLEEAGREALEALAEEEREMAEDAGDLQEAVEGLRMKMEELPGTPLSDVDAVLEEMTRQDMIGQLNSISQSLEQGQRQQAQTEGDRAQASLKALSERMRAIQKQIEQNQREKVARALRRASYRLLQLSEGQERLMAASAAEGKVSRSQSSAQQMSLLSGLSQVADSLVQLSQETFMVTPEMGKAMGQARAQMQRSLQVMEQAGGKSVSIPQGEAMGGLNRAVLAILDALERMEGGGSGLGMEDFLLQLEQMAAQQQMINQRTRDLLQQGRLTLEQQASMARLAAEQQALKRAMENLMREFGNRPDVMGRLDRLAEEMEEVVRELKQENARQETIQRQERILSRLLDAQRSVRRRDYSRRRRSEAGRDVVRESPAPLVLGTPEWQERIRRDILRMAKEGYTAEYQELIRKYFEALISEQDKNR